ncbi:MULTISPECIES: two-component system response regulator NarL [Pantoea]|jgi:two-component system nitrate/nitrite response regulator NarP|uniref:LuxR family two component transcriptional regulator n=1 Tax=Enterobacter agglomerans TaxID=549 RepID=A0A6B3J9D6_ENTAG|nr:MULTISPECIES: two-component system response regulator NarL [Pantoea]MDF9911399.1 two-component system nitrate/nitrite response regulator NarP [Pantoea brenneri]ERM10449.1 transcriptional regulator [Pantoea agglomerans Tx10]KEY44158.1 nitrate/nitrite response regulator protein narP [Pantoea agglomerans]KJH62939.1 transcriptional regulator NarP [Pantoea agglomerans]KOA69268.1 transcriptional regulator NarP [Pantoea sp. CFSAN033090]
MQQPALTLMIVDDHPLMRRGVRQLLALDPRLEVIAEASNGTEALAEARHQEPDIILLDLNMKGMSGLDTLKALRHEGISSRILVLTVSDARSDIFAMVDAGADGYLLKDSEPEVLLAHILQASRGEKVFSEGVTRYLANRQHSADPLRQLTERERDVLQEVARGLSNKEVAAILHISEETVKVHIRNLLRKLDVRSRVAATVMWLESRK